MLADGVRQRSSCFQNATTKSAHRLDQAEHTRKYSNDCDESGQKILRLGRHTIATSKARKNCAPAQSSDTSMLRGRTKIKILGAGPGGVHIRRTSADRVAGSCPAERGLACRGLQRGSIDSRRRES